jgi:2-polyprenyl-3-methyl-5-hydroxy-6-metoxy-1,4-benzoquinol methylase
LEPPAPPIPADTIAKLSQCPACGHDERTGVCRFNRFALSESPPDEHAGLYRYALCHRCGVVYATRRPEGPRYRWLFEHFDDTLGRIDRAGKVAITPRKLTPDEQEGLRHQLARGVYVSDHLGLSTSEYFPSLMNDRLASSPHVEMIGSLVPVRNARVLEIRSKLGSISEGLRRLHGAHVQAMTLFENQQFIIQEAYGIPAVCGVDFDRFTIPFDGEFDLIIGNHMLTHSVRPREFLAEVRTHLASGGYLYLHSEMDEGEYLEDGKSMFNFNPFHMQAFNRESLMRVLAASGFTTTFMTMYRGAHVCLARKDAEAGDDWPPMPERERKRRRSAYRKASDMAVLMMPEHARAQITDWDEVLQRGIAEGYAELSKHGTVKLRDAKRQ